MSSPLLPSLLFLLFLLLSSFTPPCSGYRPTDDPAVAHTPFSPYESGFVGVVGRPANYGRERVNEGGTRTQEQSGEGIEKGRMDCPGMVGPMKDKKYYCVAKEYGYCDRRSGACFCNVGYSGNDCSSCSPTHVRHGGLCYPKKLCPKDCGGGGTCDYLTGVCSCSPHRTGDDCLTPRCTLYDKYCTDCVTDPTPAYPNGVCTQCIEAYSVVPTNPLSQQCSPCSRFDPRCLNCDATRCLQCFDVILNSAKRSGPRPQDGALPDDERRRELAITVPFNSNQNDAFDEAEPYVLVGGGGGPSPSAPPLRSVAKSCDQGTTGDSSWNCSAVVPPISHNVCGAAGTISFDSPSYAVYERHSSARIKVRRTGGGVGTVSATYELEHISTTGGDVTPTHYYTTEQKITFAPGEVEKTFLVAVHDNRRYEGDKKFRLTLSNAEGGASIGPQYFTTVTILEDDGTATVASLSKAVPRLAEVTWTSFDQAVNEVGSFYLKATPKVNRDTHTRAVAGKQNRIVVKARDRNSNARTVGNDVFMLELRESKFRFGNDDRQTSGKDSSRHHWREHYLLPGSTPRLLATDLGNGTYTADLVTTTAGKYDLHTYLLVPGGVMGHYFDDPYFSDESLAIVRVDETIQFSWGTGRVTASGTDFVSVWWGGYVNKLNTGTEDVTFTLVFDDNVRLFVDGSLIVDQWDVQGGGTASGAIVMAPNTYYRILVEYRDVRGAAGVVLKWSSANIPLAVVPKKSLFYAEDVMGSPFNYTVIANAANAAATTARGAGLFSGVAGKEHTFSIESRDAYGNFRGDFDLGYGGVPAFYDKRLNDVARLDGFVGVATLTADASSGGYGDSVVPVSITYNNATRRFDAKYTPKKSGVYRLDVALSNEMLGYWTDTVTANPPAASSTVPLVAASSHIFGSPFVVTTSTDVAAAARSVVYGGFGNCLGTVTPGSTPYDTNTGSTWGGAWTSTNCDGFNHGLTGVEQFFYIDSRDINNNLLVTGGDKWQVVAHSRGSQTAFAGKVDEYTDVNGLKVPGKYKAYVTPQTSGEYYLDVTLNGAHAKGSPFQLFVRHDNAYGPTSFVVPNPAFSDALQPWRTVTASPTVNTVDVQLVDKMGNIISSNLALTGSPYTTTTVASVVGDVTAAFTYQPSGILRITYSPTKIGLQKLSVKVNNEHIKGSPFDINVLPGSLVKAVGETNLRSTASGPGILSATAGVQTGFLIQSRDQNSNPRTSNADTFTVVGDTLVLDTNRPADYDTMVMSSSTSATFSGTVTYTKDGLYDVKYNATVSGTYQLRVKGGATNDDIVGSPFTVVVYPNVASATESVVTGSGTRTGTAGDILPIEIYTRDVFGNSLVAGGDKINIKVLASLTSHVASSWETGATGIVVNGVDASGLQNPVGSYQFSIPVVWCGNEARGESKYKAYYTPPYSGSYTITALLETPNGLWGTYYRSEDFATTKLSLVKHDGASGGLDFAWGNNSPVVATSPSTSPPTVTLESGVTCSITNGANTIIPGSSLAALTPPMQAGDWVGLGAEVFTITSIASVAPFTVTLSAAVQAATATGISIKRRVPSLPSENYSVSWSGYIEAEHDEEYEIGAECDSYSMFGVTIDGVEVVPFQNCGGKVGRVSRKVMMTAFKRVSVLVQYSKKKGDSFFKLMWASPSQGKWSVVNAARFYRDIVMSGKVYTPTYTPNSPSPQQSTAVGAAVTSAVAGISHSFTVECRDAYGAKQDQKGQWGNRQLAGGCVVSAIGRGVSGGATDSYLEGVVTDNADGTYTVLYTPQTSGSYLFSIFAQNSPLTKQSRYYDDLAVVSNHVIGSPFILNVSPGVAVATKTHIDIKTVAAALVSTPQEVIIWSRDVMNNRLLTGGYKFQVFLSTVSGGDTYGKVDTAGNSLDSNIYANVKDNRDGTYVATFVPTKESGQNSYRLHVKLLEFNSAGAITSRTSILGSPYEVQVWPSEPVATTSHIKSGQSTRLLVAAAPGGVINSFVTSTNTIRRFYVQASDASGNDWWQGGSNFIARVRGVTDVTYSNTLLKVTDLNDGSYQVEMTLDKAGTYEIDVFLAKGVGSVVQNDELGVDLVSSGGGLTGSYFNNQHLLGTPAFARVDETINFNWGHGLITATAIDFVSVRWTGYIKTPYTEDVTFELNHADDYAKLWIDGTLVVDTSTGQTSGSFSVQQNMLYTIKVEFFETDLAASVRLMWSSLSFSKHVVPKNFLFYEASPIQGSPFALTVT